MYSDVVKGAEITSEREKLAWLLAVFGIGLGLACGIGWYRASGQVRTVEKVVEKPIETVRERIVEVPKEVIRTVEAAPKVLTPTEHFAAVINDAKLLYDKDLLKGIGKIRVDILLGEKASGFADMTALQTKAELRLRSLGISVGTEKELPALLITYEGIWTGDENSAGRLFCHSTSASLGRYGVFIVAGSPYFGEMKAWSHGSTGYAGTARTKESVTNAVEGMIDAFANAYLAANPKP